VPASARSRAHIAETFRTVLEPPDVKTAVYESQWDVVTGCRSATLKTAALPGYRGVRFARLPLEVSLRGISAVPTCRNAMVRVLAHSVRPAYSLW